MRLAPVRAMVKEAALVALGSNLAVRAKLRRLRRSGLVTILNLHRVAADDRSAYAPLDPKLFDYLLTFATRHFHLTTFERARQEGPSGKPKMILSFDDAYRDFLTVAVPLLEKHGLRVNQNVIPECIETGLPPLNVLMQDFVGRAPWDAVRRMDLPGFAWGTSPEGAGSRVTNFLKNRPIAEQERLREKLMPQLRAVADFEPTPMMTREEVRQIGRVHEIGAHSYAHASMAHETEDYLRADVRRCREYFAEELGLPLDIYALPNGSYRPEQIGILREEGIRDILLVDEDFAEPGTDLHTRFTFDGRSRHEVRFRATGAFRQLRNRERPQ